MDERMSKKEVIKNIIGPTGIEAIRKMKMTCGIVRAYKAGTIGCCEVKSFRVRLKEKLSIKDKNVFFGYYDLQQINEKQTRMLVHICDRKANTQRDAVAIAYYDLVTHQFVNVAESRAWSWQQGCRLRWNPLNQNEILFNNLENGRYVCQIWNVEQKKKIQTIPIPLYDIDAGMHYGLGVNFSRLQRLRPGYGYNSLSDKTINQNIPQNDGIFLYDFYTNEVRNIIKYEKLCEGFQDTQGFQHYINHVCISPNGKQFMFFHIFTKGTGMEWNVRLCVSDINGNDIKILEENHTISHYTWKNDFTLLTTYINREGKGSCYAEYDINTGKRTAIGGDELKLDGHPTFFKGNQSFISDTYPKRDCLQTVFLYDMKKNEYEKLVDIFHTPRLYEEKRCDLHPRLTWDNKYFSIDTVYADSLRSVLLFEVNI